MKRLSFLQVGDIHFPESKSDTLIDLKDDAAPAAFSEQLVPNKLQNVVRQIKLALDEGKGKDGLLICGDLTTRGDEPGYSECLTYLSTAIGIADPTDWPDERLHVVLGNHDLNRATAYAGGTDPFAKFTAFRSAWQTLRPFILPVDQVRTVNTSTNGCKATIVSLNSCIGCGEKRHLPEQVKEQLHLLLASHLSAAALDATAFELIGEQLDTPAFLEQHVTEVVERIQEADSNTAVFVLAHHGLLPQAIVRIAVYTELLNAGLARFRLSMCDHPVIFCHGHIHEDPVEIVTQARSPAGKLILISAPELRDGFNLINIHFSHTSRPVGCEVIPYRRATHGGVHAEPPIRIQLASALNGLDDVHPLIRDVLPVLTPAYKRFRDVLSDTRARTGTHHQDRTLEASLQEAEWLGLIDILDRSTPPKYWQIRRIEP